MNHFTDIINLWPNCEELGRDINISGIIVRAWKRRDTIPSRFWLAIVEAARKRGFTHITVDLLAYIAAKKADTVPNSGPTKRRSETSKPPRIY